ncbi:phenylacetate--CoA ligase family protein [Ktedonosporobacter rubrisoli]|uniref:Phenylacetate--CoA ligase family protein n=1 Tax=Ktedonosporobacter rubrisoli TaxID=2509675 RepID=A0A4P6JUU9_KTERU|nr:phenylacetate--CoA ligase family protein [Ktedonosporobacter rubrisoli]QBD79428.1 phenylacetate--CoA ligase family protein [Ktedonosporobacter rubrisoli]
MPQAHTPDRVQTLPLLLDASRARKQGLEAIMQRQRTRLAEIVTYTRANSPYYRELYQHLQERIEDPALLPVTSKKILMPHFDDWATDRRVNIEQVSAFVDNPDLIGERFLGKYLVATTSGTSGRRGIFLQDEWSMAVSYAVSPRDTSGLGARDLIKILALNGRLALVIATGGHFMGSAGSARTARENALYRKRVKLFSVRSPLPELVEQLNQFRPAILFGYASQIIVLTGEQEAGRLHIHPALVQAGAEMLPASEFERIARAFQAKVSTAYAATECPFLSVSCKEGWYHANSDWVVFEPVDADYRPVSPGTQSHTVLISNLANRVQPILRYDLGDSILQRPDPCPCGSPFPAFRVHGRIADVLTFPTERGEHVSIAPLVFGSLIDSLPGIALFQIVQTTPTNLRLRLRYATGADPDSVWQHVQSEVTRVLTEYKVGHITLERAEEPPQQSPGGKYRSIIPLS